MEDIFKYPEGHPCYGCSHTFQVSLPSCSIGCDMNNCDLRRFGKRLGGIEGKSNHKETMTASEKIFAFIEVLEGVKKLKGYK